MREEWRPVVGYEGLYEVSNMGNVKSLNYNHTGKEGILKPRKNRDSYLLVNLWKDAKMKTCLIHRLVATAFIENPEGYTEVNHKDENPKNNNVDNLEWCSVLYNNTYNDRAKKIGEKRRNDPKTSKPIIRIDKVTGLIAEFPSIMEASRQTGIDPGNLCACLKGRLKSCGGFVWYYDDAEQ